MAFGSGKRFREIFSDSFSGEAGPCGKETFFNSLDPRGEDGTKARAVQEIKQLCFVGLLICTVGHMLIGRVLCWVRIEGACWVYVHKPHAVGWIAEPDDGCNAIFDDAGVFLVEEHVVATMVAELSKGDECFVEAR